MDIRSFSSLLRAHKLALFSAGDLKILLSPSARQGLSLRLHQWRKKGWVSRIKRGLYQLDYPEPPVIADLYLANRIYEPSYVSLETALSHYQILPEFSAQVTSVSSKPTRRFINSHGLFTYTTIRSSAYAGYTVLNLQGWPVRMAEPEKAVIDRLYIALRRGEDLADVGDRWDKARIRRMNFGKLRGYAAIFKSAENKLKRALDAFI